MELDIPDALDIDENELDLLKGVLHIAGDAVTKVALFPKEEEEFRQNVVNAIVFIMLNARNGMEDAIDSLLAAQAMKGNLKKGFTYEEIFGFDPVAELKEAAPSEHEQHILKEYFDDENAED